MRSESPVIVCFDLVFFACAAWLFAALTVPVSPREAWNCLCLRREQAGTSGSVHSYNDVQGECVVTLI